MSLIRRQLILYRKYYVLSPFQKGYWKVFNSIPARPVHLIRRISGRLLHHDVSVMLPHLTEIYLLPIKILSMCGTRDFLLKFK